GPFGFLHIARKDMATNLAALLRTRAFVGNATPMRIVVTVETEDEVEGWDAPVAHTLGELHQLGQAIAFDGRSWRRAADGAFVVWGNSVGAPEWRALADAFAQLSAPAHEPRHALTFDEEDALALARSVPTGIEPDELYAHLDGAHGYAITPAGAAPVASRSPAPARRA